MRPFHLKLIATALFCVCALLVIRSSHWQESGSNQPALSDSSVPSPRSRNASAAPSTPPPPANAATAPASPATEPAAQPSTGSPTSAAQAATSRQPLGIRLADNVQLPAVILALTNPNRDPNHKIPAPVAAAMQSIVDTFYQDLAAAAQGQSAAGQSAAGQATAATAPGGDDTAVIQPGPAVDQARARANEAYRALFGDEAYNQLTLNAALEVKLPVAAPAGTP